MAREIGNEIKKCVEYKSEQLEKAAIEQSENEEKPTEDEEKPTVETKKEEMDS